MFFSGNQNTDEKLKKLLIVIEWMLIFAGAVYVLSVLRPAIAFVLKAITPFAVALILAYIFDPIISFVQKRLKLPRILGLVVFYILILFIIALFMLLILPEVFKQTADLFKMLKDTLPQKIMMLKEKYNIPFTEDEIRSFIDKLNISQIKIEKANEALMPGLKTVATGGVSAAGSIAKGLASGISSIFSFISILMFVIVINFYFLMDFSKISPIIKKILPQKNAPRIIDMLGKIDTAVGGFLRGQAIDCALIGILTTIGLLIMGFKQYAILIGFITGVGNAIPYLGPPLGGIPSILWILLSDSYEGMKAKAIGIGILVLLFAVIQTIDGLIFQPKIVGKNSQLHPLAVLFALYVGAQFGFFGMIIAIPLACIIRVLFIELVWEKMTAAK